MAEVTQVVEPPAPEPAQPMDYDASYWLKYREQDNLMLVLAEGQLHWDTKYSRFDPDNQAAVWNADTGQAVASWRAPEFYDIPAGVRVPFTFGVAFSPDGHLVATGSDDEKVRLWNPDNGQPVGPPLNLGRNETAMAFSPGGHRLATASNDHTVQLWNVDARHSIGAPLNGHTKEVNAITFSPDGHRLATASNDNTVRLWDADTGQPIGEPLTGHLGGVTSVAFSPDGQRLASGGGDKTVQLWPGVATPEMLCDKITTNMSRQQWHDWVSPDIPYITLCPGLPIAVD